MSFQELIKLKNYPVAMIASTFIAGCIVETVFRITCFLDPKYPWESVFFKRLTKQMLWGVIFPLIMAAVFASVYFGVFGVNILDTVYFTLYFPSIVFMVLILNAYYMAHYAAKLYMFYHKRDRVRYLSLKPAGEDENIPSPENVVFIFCRKKVYFFISPSGVESIWPYTREETVDLLSPEEFIFIRRAYIVKLDNVLSVSPESSRRYRLILKVPENKSVIVSQRHARDFKKLLQKYV
jgi:hypothetical protein